MNLGNFTQILIPHITEDNPKLHSVYGYSTDF
jgi:hypothetical protein